MNARLFIERESLEALEDRYRAWDNGFNSSVVLPDPPVVRHRGPDQQLELLAGHRRLTAAHTVGVTRIPCRVVDLTDEEAFLFIREANNYEVLTTAEKAYSIAEMDRLGFSFEEIRKTMGTIGLNRYLFVGRMINPDWFSDIEKLCNPSITVWAYAARHGEKHFEHCFRQWDSGAWTEEDCNSQFRKAGTAVPPEPYQAGAIMSVDATGKVLRFRGTLDIGRLTPEQIIEKIVNPFIRDLNLAARTARGFNHFGPKRNARYSDE